MFPAGIQTNQTAFLSHQPSAAKRLQPPRKLTRPQQLTRLLYGMPQSSKLRTSRTASARKTGLLTTRVVGRSARSPSRTHASLNRPCLLATTVSANNIEINIVNSL